MKTVLFFLLFLFVASGYASTDTLDVKTSVTDVTVFLQGAQITRSGNIQLKPGRQMLEISGLPVNLNPQSIQVEPIKNCEILTVSHAQRSASDPYKNPMVARFEQIIRKLEIADEEYTDQYTTLEMELSLLLTNEKLNTQPGDSPVTELRNAADFFHSRIGQILKQKTSIRRLQKEKRDSITLLREQIGSLTFKQRQPSQSIYILLECKQSVNQEAVVEYFVASSGWNPTYDFRVEEVGAPFRIVYNSTIYQSTGEDWHDVRLTLSCSNPLLSRVEPKLNPWKLGQTVYSIPESRVSMPGSGTIKGKIVDGHTGEPIPFANIIAETGGVQVAGATSDFDGNYMLRPVSAGYIDLKISFIGYHTQIIRRVVCYADKITFQDINLNPSDKQLEEVVVMDYKVPLISKDQTVSGGTVQTDEFMRLPGKSVSSIATSVGGIQMQPQDLPQTDMHGNTVSSKVTHLEYALDKPYSVPSDGNHYFFKIKEVSIPVTYHYLTIPKEDPDAFLLAGIPSWQQFNLMKGEASIFYQGTFTGSTFLNLRTTEDTLQVSVGRDRSISVERRIISEKQEKRTLGSSIRETLWYEIQVQNNNDDTVSITVKDQVPVSVKSTITIEILEASGAKEDKDTGILTWNLNLPPAARSKLTVGFTVKYPDNEVIKLY